MIRAEEIVRIIAADGTEYEAVVCLVCPHPLSSITATVTVSMVVKENAKTATASVVIREKDKELE